MRHVIGEDDHELNHVPYPVQQGISYFPERIREKCLGDFNMMMSSSSSTPPRNFAEYTKLCLGETLQEIFIRPYNEKVSKQFGSFSVRFGR
jgi:hypothetical protein